VREGAGALRLVVMGRKMSGSVSSGGVERVLDDGVGAEGHLVVAGSP
jgi:hypothetical protein